MSEPMANSDDSFEQHQRMMNLKKERRGLFGKSKTKLFVSYRSEDRPMSAGRIFDFAENAIGKNKVFMDVSGICMGRSWEMIIGDELNAAKTVLAVIGPEWIRLFGRAPIRLDVGFGEDIDYLALELIRAHKAGKLIIPVLVDNAEEPRKDQLPEQLNFLPSLQYANVSHSTFSEDMDRIIGQMRR